MRAFYSRGVLALRHYNLKPMHYRRTNEIVVLSRVLVLLAPAADESTCTHKYALPPVQGKYEQAVAFFDRAIGIWEAAMGSDHPMVAVALDSRAGVLAAQVRGTTLSP